MSAAANLDWLYHLLGYTLAAAGLLLLLWSLFWDRSRGRRRCPKCWYDMKGAPGPACPECGHSVHNEQQFYRTRRRRWLAFAATCLVPVAYLVHSWPLIKAEGWAAPIPTGVLLHFYPWTADTALGNELLDRAALRYLPGRRPPTDELLAACITRAARGNWLARPTSPRWQRTYGQILKRLRTITHLDKYVLNMPWTPPPQGISKALDEWASIPPHLEVRTRAKWPRGSSIVIDATPQFWWPVSVEWEQEAEWRATGTDKAGKLAFRNQFRILPDVPGRVTLEGTVRMFQADTRPDGKRRQVASVPFRFECSIVETVDEAMQAVASPQLDEALANKLTATIDIRRGLRFQLEGAVPPGYDDVVFGATIEVLSGDRPIQTIRLVSGGLSDFAHGKFANLESVYTNHPDAPKLRRAEVDPAWRVRVRSNPLRAAQHPTGEKYWKGEFVIPFAKGPSETILEVR